MPRAFVVANPRSGRRRPWMGPAVVEQLRRARWTVEPFLAIDGPTVTAVAHAVRTGDADLVVAVGGDGTVATLAETMAGSGVPLGIVPAGCGNLLAGSLGIPRSAEAATRAVMAGRDRTMDLGRLMAGGRSRTFTIACGVGFDALVMARTPRALKRRVGQPAYFATALALAGDIRATPITITTDGTAREVDAAEVLIANAAHLSGRFGLRSPVALDDGLLDVIVVTASGRASALAAVVELLRDAPRGEPGRYVWRTQASEVRLEAPERKVECDGDVVATTPVAVTVVPAALNVRVPRA